MPGFILTIGGGQFGALRLNTDQLAAALRTRGIDVLVFDLLDPPTNTELEAFVCHGELLGAAGFNGMGANLRSGTTNLWDALGIPFVALCVDHPAHVAERFHGSRPALPERFALTFLDPRHLDACEALGLDGMVRSTALLMPGASAVAEPVDTQNDRTIDVLFTGSVRPRRDHRPQTGVFVLDRLINDAIDHMLADPSRQAHDSVAAALAGCKFRLHRRPLELAHVQRLVDGFVATERRFAFLDSIAAAGVAVTAYGIGFEPYLDRWNSFQVAGPGTAADTLALCHQARIVLNTNNNFAAGGHERVFTAMAAGAHVVSDSSSFYDQAFGPERMTCFSWDQVGRVGHDIAALLEDLDRCRGIARAGQAVALAEHSWAIRAARLLDIAELTGVELVTRHG